MAGPAQDTANTPATHAAATLPLVYHPDYVAPLPDGHRFPMPKFGLLHEHLRAVGIADTVNVHAPRMPTRDELLLVHAPTYLDAFVTGALDEKALRRIGLPWSAPLAHRTQIAVGGTIRTAELALAHGLACNTAGGTHHAFADFGAGFCILNDLAVTARVLLERGDVDQILIIDLDVHQGDGTAHCLRDEPRAFTFSMHCGKNFPMRKQASDLDVPLPIGMTDADYMRALARHLPDLIERVEPDLVLYDAGVDPHADDQLDRLALSDAGLFQRDAYVLQCCRAHHVPVACVIGGGYSKNHTQLAARHATVHHAAAQQLERANADAASTNTDSQRR